MSPLDIFQKEAPKVAKAFDGLIQSLRQSPGLDAKTKQLVYIGIKAAAGDTIAVKFNTLMARNLGATRDEIKDTILITIGVVGLKGVSTCLPAALEAYDQED